MSERTMTVEDQVYPHILEFAINAFISGDAIVSDDGATVRWGEPDCYLPEMDRLVGISLCEGRWAPLVEVHSPDARHAIDHRLGEE